MVGCRIKARVRLSAEAVVVIRALGGGVEAEGRVKVQGEVKGRVLLREVKVKDSEDGAEVRGVNPGATIKAALISTNQGAVAAGALGAAMIITEVKTTATASRTRVGKM